jgi:hypothetical protein
MEVGFESIAEKIGEWMVVRPLTDIVSHIRMKEDPVRLGDSSLVGEPDASHLLIGELRKASR